MPKTVRSEPLYSIALNQKGGQIIFNKNLPGFRMLISQAPFSTHDRNNKPIPFIIPVIIPNTSSIVLFLLFSSKDGMGDTTES